MAPFLFIGRIVILIVFAMGVIPAHCLAVALREGRKAGIYFKLKISNYSTMTIKEQLMEKIKESMKAGTPDRTNILRLAMNAIKNREVENRGKGIEGELSDGDVIDVLMKEVKRRNESADVYAQAGRQELADAELAEIAIIKEFLPEELSAEELDKIVSEAIAKTEAKEIKDMGKVMAEINPQIKGRADARAVSDLIKKKLGL